MPVNTRTTRELASAMRMASSKESRRGGRSVGQTSTVGGGAMSGTGVSVPGGSGQVKTDTRTEDEKPGDDEPGDDKPEAGESQDEKPEDERSGEDDEEPGG